jgi:hypothetical protein
VVVAVATAAVVVTAVVVVVGLVVVDTEVGIYFRLT